MASATGIPQEHPQTIEAREDEPLLGRPGDVVQKEDQYIIYNLFTGTASLAQFGIWIIAILVWAGIFSHPLILFSAHPLLNSSALLLQVQAALILQPTATPQQKLKGARIHYVIQAVKAQKLKDESQEMTTRKTACTEEINRLALSLPNLSSSETPVGDDPRLIEYLNFDPRVHEFTKVEMFAWADNAPEASGKGLPTSDDLFNELLSIQTEILTSLNLPCRVLEMPTTDLGASASRKRDIEALFPSRLRAGADLESAWGEVTSASICTDYQSRRLGTRVRGGAAKDSRFPHTVNGTAVAVPRVLAAILENGWDEKRKVVVVPEVLRNWMGGLEVIGESS
ncbi:hypothetical protein APSETT445_002129 [Aspergillus pseudonomiae]